MTRNVVTWITDAQRFVLSMADGVLRSTENLEGLLAVVVEAKTASHPMHRENDRRCNT